MYKVFAAAAAMLLCLLLIYLAAVAFPSGVRLGRNSRCCILLQVRGCEPRLEKSVEELIWLLKSSRLYGEIIIQGSHMDAETRSAARALENRYGCVIFTEDGESPWSRKTNCWKCPAR